MQETNVYTYLTPIALVFVLIEIAACLAWKRNYISFPEAIANFGTAFANQTVNVLVAAGVYVAYGYLWENYRLFTIDLNWWTFILLLLGVDFIFYWVHRWGHAINIMWAAHSPHHSAEEMNFMVALRASVTQRFSSFLFFWPLALVGFQPLHIYMMSGIHLFIAFLHHTELIGKLGWFEKYFTTPSHHRVHHGVNFPYLDKNFGEFLIIWDRIFGSFAEEQEKVVYGIYNHPHSWNPVRINFHYFIVLWNDAVATPYWWDKIRVWFMPAGWRPRGLPEKPMVEITTENQVKFRPPFLYTPRDFEFAWLEHPAALDRCRPSLVARNQLERHTRSQILALDIRERADRRNGPDRHCIRTVISAVGAFVRGHCGVGVLFHLDKSIFSAEQSETGNGFRMRSRPPDRPFNDMKLLLISALILTLTAVSLHAQNDKTSAAIRKVMDDQVIAWNKGDIDGFMAGYWRSEKLVFISGDNVTRGWQPTLDRYKKSYDSRAKMGTLTFSDLEFFVLSRDAAVVLGSWSLARDKDNPHGKFTLTFRKFKEGWRIVMDHTS